MDATILEENNREAENNNQEEDVAANHIVKIEEKIIRVIAKIRQGRSRPCYQNIHTLVNRGNEFDESVETIKYILQGMIDKSILYVKGDEGKESIYVSNDEPQIITESLEISEDCAIKSVINEQFIYTLKDIIKKECTSQINNDCFIKSLTNLIKNEVRSFKWE